MFFSAISSCFSNFEVSKNKTKQAPKWKKKTTKPQTKNPNHQKNPKQHYWGFFIYSANACDSGNEILCHLASEKLACSLPHLDCGRVGVCTWSLCWYRANAVVKVCCVRLPAVGDGVLWCGLCHWPGEEDKRELFQGRLDCIHLQRGSQGESCQQLCCSFATKRPFQAFGR